MLHAFHLHRNEHQDEPLAMESPPLPTDDIEAIDLALEQHSSDMLQAVKVRAGNIEGSIRGKTALMRVVAKDAAISIKLLLEAGANINATDRSGASALHIAVRDNKLQALQQLLTSEHLDIQDKKKALTQAFKSKKIDTFVMLAKSFAVPDRNIKENISELLYQAINKNDFNSIDKLLSIPYVDVIRSFKGYSSIHWAIKKGNLRSVVTLLPHAKLLFGIPLSVMIKDFSHFDSVQKCKEFYYSKDPISYLDTHHLTDPVTIFSLRLLQAEKDVLAYEKEKNDKNESAMDDKAVLLANRHYTQKVKPHFAEQFTAIGLVDIEKRIRKMILKAIKENAKKLHNLSLIEFIKTNKVSLINAEPIAMQESVKHFTLATPAHAAWRGYNPFAAVTSNWINLLTRPENENKIYSTTAASASNKISSFEASDIVRERVAYYYLAVIDETDGDEPTRHNRVANFIGWLADIRNAHGRDDPSCYPGYLTRIAQMGNYHAIAEQPIEIKSHLATFFRSKVFETFKAKTAELSMEDQQQLLRALVDLNHITAKDIILQPAKYSAELLPVRLAFLQLLGNESTLFEAFKQTNTYPIENDDLVYFSQHLLDITRGDIALVLEEYMRRQTDRPTSRDDLIVLNTFSNDEAKARALFADLLIFVQENVPRYKKSFHQLQGFAEYAVFKVRELLEQPENNKQCIQSLLEMMGSEEDEQLVILQALEGILQRHCIAIKISKVENPFEQQLKQMEQTIKHTRNPVMVVQLQKRLPSLQQKVQLYNHLIAYLAENDFAQEHQNALSAIAKSVVDFSVQHGALELENFKQSVLEEGDLPVSESIFNDITNKLLAFLPKKHHSQAVTFRLF